MLAKALQSAAGNAAEATYIEDVFSTWLYTGAGAAQTINNGIDLAGEGGLVWVKNRSSAVNNWLVDTVRGVGADISSNTTTASGSVDATKMSFDSTGFSFLKYVGTAVNASSTNYASWTFRKAEKWFDIVTWTGDSVAGRAISHSLGSAPGAVFIKCTSNARNWRVWHRSLTTAQSMVLNSTAAVGSTNILNSTTPTSTTLTLSADPDVNNSGYTYVAYLFAHDAGGFGDDGSENVISCGSYTGNGSTTGPVVTLDYEPQWLLVKAYDQAQDWVLIDSMRGFTAIGGNDSYVRPNLSDAEGTSLNWIQPLSNGFQPVGSGTRTNASGYNYIYIAIRRGPMKTPTTGTEVFSPVATTASGNTKITTDFPLDLQIQGYRTAATPNNSKVMTRMTGVNTSPVNTSLPYLITALSDAETTAAYTRYWDNTGFEISSGLGGGNSVYWNFQRAPSFFDVCCYTGNGVDNTQINHNLTVAPEFVIVKRRNDVTPWSCYYPATNIGLQLNGTNAGATPDFSGVSATTFTVRNFNATNANGSTYVAYLFASCPGVSKVGSYTGTAATQQINCGFTGGARFVLIKRTDSTGAWYVWDSARGIVAGNDPYLLLNSTAAEVTSTDYVDTYSAGFEISSTAPAAINASGGTFLFLAIA